MKPAIILLVIITLFSCRKKEEKPYVPIELCKDLTRNMDSINLYIQGTWEWAQEYRFNQVERKFEYVTPKTKGYNLTWKFKNDSAFLRKDNGLDSIYRFKILKESDITNYPGDDLSVVAFYSSFTGLRESYVPIKVCKDYLVTQHQYVSSIAGKSVWKRRN